MLIDTHEHVDRYDLVGEGAVDTALAEIEARQILTISNSMDPPSHRRNLEIAARCGLVLPIFGIHLWNAPEWVHRLDELRGLVEQSPMLDVRYWDHLVEITRAIPPDRLLTETDNPGGPKGPLGRPGTPALIEEVLAAVAEARGESPAQIERFTQENLLRLFMSDPWVDARFVSLLRTGLKNPRG